MNRSVFVVQHITREGQADEDVKMIGVHSSDDAARAAIDRLSRQPGFIANPDVFCVDEYRLDEDDWTEGFAADPE